MFFKNDEILTEEDYDTYEYAEEWLQRDPELSHMSLEQYNELRCIEDYSTYFDSDFSSGDEDWKEWKLIISLYEKEMITWIILTLLMKQSMHVQ